MLTRLLQANLISKAKFLLVDNSSTILTGVGVTGTVVTAVLTGRASFRAAKIIAKEEQLSMTELRVVDKTEDVPDWENADLVIPSRPLSKTEKVKLVWPHYLPPVGAGVITITSVIMANRISSKKIAALVLASGISERAFQEYKDKVIEKLGEKQTQKMEDEIAQDRINSDFVGSREVYITGTGEVLCYDMLTGRYFQSTVETIKRAENRTNYELMQFNYASLSFFYDEIGLPPTDYTDSVGWTADGHLEVRLTTTMSTDNRPCIAIDFSRRPVTDYHKYWMD